jgi:hypothetical protein
MIQAIVIQNTNYLIPNKEHKNFTDSSEEARVGTIVMGDFKNINGLRKGKPFEYRLFISKNGKILYANSVKAENVPSEILSSADNLQSTSLAEFNSDNKFDYTANIAVLVGGIAGYFYGKKQNKTGNNLIKYIAIGAVGAYAIYWVIDKNKSTKIKPSK